MSLSLYLPFLLATAILILMPGPIVGLVVANSLAHGTRRGLHTVAGSTLGNALLVTAGGLGLTTLLALMADLFTAIRVLGAAYLFWLGIKAFRSARAAGRRGALTLDGPSPSGRTVFFQGLMMAVTNPKTILFYAAFFPQFLDSTTPVGPQLAIMGATLVSLALILDGGYALLAGRLRTWFTDPRRRRLQARITGSLLITSGLGLLLMRRPA
ncbi:MAG: LysE family translocator [Rhodospirillum sp.]|nr:LysE family translocator [Rhodospirillum sp.]MCF8489802.1 LysE family translocator [Rhodospirillum sp.]MCF8501607.1 LysE family translocator [Rhodospirillum sp.]